MPQEPKQEPKCLHPNIRPDPTAYVSGPLSGSNCPDCGAQITLPEIVALLMDRVAKLERETHASRFKIGH